MKKDEQMIKVSILCIKQVK